MNKYSLVYINIIFIKKMKDLFIYRRSTLLLVIYVIEIKRNKDLFKLYVHIEYIFVYY